MAINNTVLNFFNSTVWGGGGNVNEYSGHAAGLITADMIDYPAGASTGISATLSHTIAAYNLGREVSSPSTAVSTAINDEGSYFIGAGSPRTLTFGFPSSVTAVDLNIYNCIAANGQEIINIDVNGTAQTVNSSGNINGAFATFLQIEPDVNNEIVITMNNDSGPFLMFNGVQLLNIVEAGEVSTTISGALTSTPSKIETAIVTGGETLTVTLNGDTWVSGGAFNDAIRQAIIDGITSDGVEVAGWNTEVRDKMAVSSVVRTSDSVVTITLAAAPAYDITAVESIRVTTPAAAMANTSTAYVSTTTFDINFYIDTSFTNDTFDGTGALGSHWELYDNSQGEVQNVGRVNGFFQGEVIGDESLWYTTDQGRFDYQTVEVPQLGVTDEYIFLGIGISPIGEDPLTNVVFDPNQLTLSGPLIHVDDTEVRTSMFAIAGHRGGTHQYTIETKGTINGSSSIDDEGQNAIGVGSTHCDMRVEIEDNGVVRFSYRNIGGSAWTYIRTDGQVPNPWAIGPSGTRFKIGIVGYCSGGTGVPFQFAVDSVSKTVPFTGNVSNSLVSNWSALAAVNNSSKIDWNVLNQISNTTLIEWDLLHSIVNSSAFEWSMIKGLSSSASIDWSLLAALSTVSNSAAIDWNLLEQVSNSYSLDWSMLQGAISGSNLRWNLLTQIGQNLGLEWNLNENINSVIQLDWNLLSSLLSVSNNIQINWDLIGKINSQLAAQWDLLESVGISTDLRWDLSIAIANEVQANWALSSGAISSLDLSWDSIATTSKGVQFNWSIQSDQARIPINMMVVMPENRIMKILQ